MGIKDLIIIKKVDDDDIEFLYDILKERNSKINVKHNELPTFEQHTSFVKSKPYDEWYIIMAETKKVGHIHLYNDDAIGWFVKNEYKRMGFVIPAFNELKRIHKRKKYLGRVNPMNSEAINLLLKLKFTVKTVYPDHILYEYKCLD